MIVLLKKGKEIFANNRIYGYLKRNEAWKYYRIRRRVIHIGFVGEIEIDRHKGQVVKIEVKSNDSKINKIRILKLKILKVR